MTIWFDPMILLWVNFSVNLPFTVVIVNFTLMERTGSVILLLLLVPFWLRVVVTPSTIGTQWHWLKSATPSSCGWWASHLLHCIASSIKQTKRTWRDDHRVIVRIFWLIMLRKCCEEDEKKIGTSEIFGLGFCRYRNEYLTDKPSSGRITTNSVTTESRFGDLKRKFATRHTFLSEGKSCSATFHSPQCGNRCWEETTTRPILFTPFIRKLANQLKASKQNKLNK